MLVLASASPRRGEILGNGGIAFVRQIPSGVDETPAPDESPLCYVTRLACAKASAIKAPGSQTVLGADTAVVIDGEILGKPTGAEDAARMLRLLSGRMHEVWTGVCLRNDHSQVVDAATTRVWFARLSDAVIDAYIATGEPMDKAGAYGIQGLASKFVTRIEGCYFNVMGLPIALIYAHLDANPAFML